MSGSNENVQGLKEGEKVTAELNGTAVSDGEDESFDADSPNVLLTRTVVDLDVGESPRLLCKWNMGEAAEYLSTGMLAFPVSAGNSIEYWVRV